MKLSLRLGPDFKEFKANINKSWLNNEKYLTFGHKFEIIACIGPGINHYL